MQLRWRSKNFGAATATVVRGRTIQLCNRIYSSNLNIYVKRGKFEFFMNWNFLIAVLGTCIMKLDDKFHSTQTNTTLGESFPALYQEYTWDNLSKHANLKKPCSKFSAQYSSMFHRISSSLAEDFIFGCQRKCLFSRLF